MIDTVFLKRAISLGKKMRNELSCDIVVIEDQEPANISEKYRVLTMYSFLGQQISNKQVVCLFVHN